MEIAKISDRTIRLLAATLGSAAIVLPRVEGVRAEGEVYGEVPVGPFSGGLVDGNVLVMSALLIASAGLVTWLWPARAPRPAVIVGLAPAAWSLVLIVVHGDEGFWPLILAFALGYGGVMAATGVVLGKAAAWLSRVRRPPEAPHPGDRRR
jgi:hypothetical protein